MIIYVGIVSLSVIRCV